MKRRAREKEAQSVLVEAWEREKERIQGTKREKGGASEKNREK